MNHLVDNIENMKEKLNMEGLMIANHSLIYLTNRYQNSL